MQLHLYMYLPCTLMDFLYSLQYPVISGSSKPSNHTRIHTHTCRESVSVLGFWTYYKRRI